MLGKKSTSGENEVNLPTTIEKDLILLLTQ